jgi:hypothetical protein
MTPGFGFSRCDLVRKTPSSAATLGGIETAAAQLARPQQQKCARLEFHSLGRAGFRTLHTQQALALAAATGKSTVGVPHERTDRAQTAGY